MDEQEVDLIVKALRDIAEKDGMTMFAECCVENDCRPEYRDGKQVAACTHQSGVNRGYGECARIAKEALSAWDAAQEKK